MRPNPGFIAVTATLLLTGALGAAGCSVQVYDTIPAVRVVDNAPLRPARPEETPSPVIVYGSGTRNPIIQSFTANPTHVVRTGQAITFMVQAHDPRRQVLQYTWAATGGTLSTNAGQMVSWQPPAKAGVYTVSVAVGNGDGGFAMASLNLTVEDDGQAAPASAAPVASPSPAPTPSASPTSQPDGAKKD